ncbi:PD-(D/E)XK nuclease family protein [Nocardia sp. NPDC101769]|uniref:PD-(D/E)XK nuclease family protein n=1 Tax=Nocardia sp. NPDC101769 TaxID=3364333 RepID=UPI00380B4036
MRDRADVRGIRRFERTAWGRRYSTVDGQLRELWLPSIGTVRDNRPDAELAAAAAVLAKGGPAVLDKWWLPYSQRGDHTQAPQSVRVVGFGSLDGRVEELFEGDQHTVAQAYKTHTAPVFARAVGTADPIAGSSCVACKAIDGCTTLVRTEALWGSPVRTGLRRPRRSLSVWDLRVHTQCPARYHLTRQLNLRDSDGESPAIRRGRAVDAWLNEHHNRPAPDGCRGEPGPSDPGHWSAGGHELTGSDARDGAAMLQRHRALCPLGRTESFADFEVQRQVTTYVPELDVVVIATPDLLYTDAGGWVWRETKTSRSPLWDRAPLMRTYPQLAMATLLLAAGALPGAPRRARVELEVLTPDRCALETLDPSRSDVVDQAREVIAEMAEPLLSDEQFAPRTDQHCRDCEVRRWCAAGREYLIPAIDSDTGQEHR